MTVKKAFFMKRLNDHLQYLKKIDATLKGGGDFQGTSHKNCKLGQWLYGEGLTEVGTMENAKAKEVFESLLKPHEHFHTCGSEAIVKKRAGDETSAQALFTDMHVLSNELINKLLELDGMN